MLYIDKNPLPGMGRSKLWRVFADTTVELRSALRGAGAKFDIRASGDPGEHAVVTTSHKNKLSGTEADMRTLVKLIKRKRNAAPEPFTPEEADAFDASLDDVVTPKTGGVSFHTKAQPDDDNNDAALFDPLGR